MNQSIYTERENILPHHAEWLDGCGAVWYSGGNYSDKHEDSQIIYFGESLDEGQHYLFVHSSNATHISTGTKFCERVAEILGLPKPVFEVDISKKETTIKGMAIEYKRLSPDEKKWLYNEIEQWEPEYDYIFLNRNKELDSGLLKYLDGYTITESPTEFLEYVSKQTGKEYNLKPVPSRTVEKPPIGLRPKYIADEERMQEIQEAINRYKMGNKPVPEEWLQEHYNLNLALCSVQHPHKTYRILDSLDGIPLDTRIPLSEWIPPYKTKVNFIHKGWFEKGIFKSIHEDRIVIGYGEGKEASVPLDGHWMRIV